MFDKNPEDRLRAWAEFRNNLQTSKDPIQEVINLYENAPTVSIQMDPYDTDTWLSPWELLLENQYCKFAKILGITYTLALSEVFSIDDFEITIITDKEKSEVKYVLFIADNVIGYHDNFYCKKDKIPNDIVIEKCYNVQNYL